MQLGEVFERFIQQAPISVNVRTLLEHALDPTEIDRIFEDNANVSTRRCSSPRSSSYGRRRLRGPALRPRRLPQLAR